MLAVASIITVGFMGSVIIGNALPVIGIGIIATLTTAFTASVTFGCTVAALSIAALAWHQRLAQPGC